MSDVATAERVLPHSLEAEKCVLGAALINSDAFLRATEVITARDFFRDAHRRIFQGMADLAERHVEIDFITLREELARSGQLEEVGGPAYLSSLVDGVPRSANVEYYAGIVKERSTLRDLIRSANRIASKAYSSDEGVEDILDAAQQSIFEIAEGRIHRGFVPLQAIVKDSFETIEKLQAHQSFVTGVPTGFEDLDRLTSGFQPADLVIVAARPSMGKTSFVLNVALHVAANRGGTVGFFSLEMAREQLFFRLLTSEAQVDWHKVRSGVLGDREWSQLSHAVGRLGEAPIYIDDTAAIGVVEMRAKARRLKAEHGLDLLIVDYLQLMQARGHAENRTQELAAISRALKGLAKELHVPIVALSQLSRAPEARADHRPQLSDLRESGALEQDADVVLLIFREEVYSQDPSKEGLAEIHVAKQRNGPIGAVTLTFLKQYTRFENHYAGR